VHQRRNVARRVVPIAEYERGQRLACPYPTLPRLSHSVSGVVLARICPHCATPVQPTAKTQLPIFGLACLLPEFVRSRLDLLLARFGHYDLLQVVARSHLQGAWPLIGRSVPDQLEGWPADSSPHEAAGSSGRLATRHRPWRALHRIQQARTVSQRSCAKRSRIRVHKLLRDANLPELHLFNSGEALSP
jgi:hypothetical protein